MGAKLEAVFIDEGFGALDDETLERSSTSWSGCARAS
jgi:DNA repair exonuclease SbcCD ATPase subunit